MHKVQISRGTGSGKKKGSSENCNVKAEDCYGCSQTEAQIEAEQCERISLAVLYYI